MKCVVRILPAIILAAACVSPLGAQVPERPDTVRLRFDWPAGMSARVQMRRVQERVAETADTVVGGARYTMNVRAHAEGRVVSYDDFVFPPPADTGEASKMTMLAEQASAIVPRFIVDSAGAFVRIDDVATVKAQFDSLLTRMLEPAEAAAAREGLETMITEESLGGLAAQEWNAIVGQWAGEDLVAGEVYEYVEEASLPMIPGATVPMVSEFSVARRTSCDGKSTAVDCVEIRLTTRPDPVAMSAILEKYVAGLRALPGVGAISYERLELENETILVTEPSTLRPHSVRISKRVTGVVTAEGERSEVSQSDTRTYRYLY